MTRPPDIPRKQAPMTVGLRFEPGAWSDREGALWVEPPVQLRRADGSLEVYGQSANLPAMVRYVLSCGAAVEVLHPERLREAVRHEVWRLSVLYGNATP